MKTTCFLPLIIFWLLTRPLWSQNVSTTTLFHENPLSVSTALAGTSCGARITTNYRNNWFPDLILIDHRHTVRAAFDAPIRLKSGDQIGLGTQIFYAKPGNELTEKGAFVHLNYQKRLLPSSDDQHWIIGGLQVGYASQNYSSLRWGNQNIGGFFNPDIPSGENPKLNDLDFGIGLSYVLKMVNNNQFMIGTNFSQLNKSSTTITNQNGMEINTRSVRINLFAMGTLVASEHWHWLPRAIAVLEGDYSHSDLGLELKRILGPHALRVGLGVRLLETVTTDFEAHSLLLSFGYDYKNFTLSASHDLDILREGFNYTSYAALEFSLGYRFCE